MVRGARLARPIKESNLSQSSGRSENSFVRMRGKLRRSEGSGMLIGDPLGEGSNASSTNNELWRVENSLLRMRGNLDAQKGAACS